MWLVILVLLVVGSPVMAQSPTPEMKRSLRAFLEPEIAKETEAALRDFMTAARARGTDESPDLPLALSGVKSLVYNSAYARYRCMLENIRSPDLAGECYRKAILELYASYKIFTEYTAQVAPRSKRCQLEARLFEAELEFPPYKFLEGEGMNLYDHGRMAACLRK